MPRHKPKEKQKGKTTRCRRSDRLKLGFPTHCYIRTSKPLLFDKKTGTKIKVDCIVEATECPDSIQPNSFWCWLFQWGCNSYLERRELEYPDYENEEYVQVLVKKDGEQTTDIYQWENYKVVDKCSRQNMYTQWGKPAFVPHYWCVPYDLSTRKQRDSVDPKVFPAFNMRLPIFSPHNDWDQIYPWQQDPFEYKGKPPVKKKRKKRRRKTSMRKDSDQSLKKTKRAPNSSTNAGNNNAEKKIKNAGNRKSKNAGEDNAGDAARSAVLTQMFRALVEQNQKIISWAVDNMAKNRKAPADPEFLVDALKSTNEMSDAVAAAVAVEKDDIAAAGKLIIEDRGNYYWEDDIADHWNNHPRHFSDQTVVPKASKKFKKAGNRAPKSKVGNGNKGAASADESITDLADSANDKVVLTNNPSYSVGFQNKFLQTIKETMANMSPSSSETRGKSQSSNAGNRGGRNSAREKKPKLKRGTGNTLTVHTYPRKKGNKRIDIYCPRKIQRSLPDLDITSKIRLPISRTTHGDNKEYCDYVEAKLIEVQRGKSHQEIARYFWVNADAPDLVSLINRGWLEHNSRKNAGERRNVGGREAGKSANEQNAGNNDVVDLANSSAGSPTTAPDVVKEDGGTTAPDVVKEDEARNRPKDLETMDPLEDENLNEKTGNETVASEGENFEITCGEIVFDPHKFTEDINNAENQNAESKTIDAKKTADADAETGVEDDAGEVKKLGDDNAGNSANKEKPEDGSNKEKVEQPAVNQRNDVPESLQTLGAVSEMMLSINANIAESKAAKNDDPGVVEKPGEDNAGNSENNSNGEYVVSSLSDDEYGSVSSVGGSSVFDVYGSDDDCF